MSARLPTLRVVRASRCILIAAAAAGCLDQATSPSVGRMALSVSSNASLAAVESWTVSLNGPSGSQTLTGTPGSTITIGNLLPGSYSIILEGFEGSDLAQRGQSTASITAGGTTVATIAVAPVPATVSVVATDASASEIGADPGAFTITRTGSVSGALAVNVVISGTATPTADYAAIGTIITIAPGQRSALVAVTPVVDTVFEGGESVTLTVAAGSAYTVGTPASATISIADAPVVTVIASDPNASEAGLDPGAFRISRTGVTSAPLAVSVAISGSASGGADYTAIASTITIPAGDATVEVPVIPIADVLVEGNETVQLTVVANASSYVVGAPESATVTIADGALPSVSVSVIDSTATELGPTPATFRLLRSAVTNAPLAVTITLAGTATSGVDYQAVQTVQTIPANAGFIDINIVPLTDALVEGPETVVLNIANGNGYVIGTPSSGGIVILDLPTLSASRSFVSFAAFPNAPLPLSQTVQLSATGGSSLPVSMTILYQRGTPGWLDGASIAATTPATLTLPIKTTALAAGAYMAVVRVASPGISSHDIQVTYTTAPGTGFGDEQFGLVSAGTFVMGSLSSQVDELPKHTVKITRPFRMQLTEVTQGQWRSVMGTNPSGFASCGDTCPVESVSWNDTQLFIQQLNLMDPGKNYRLPSEAEWEYSARAGTTGDYGGNNVLDDMGWWSGNAGNTTHAVVGKRANAWGLYDMHGNVFELVNDWYSSNYYSVSPSDDPRGPSGGSTKVSRGGSWGTAATFARSAYRDPPAPTARSTRLGFRLARDP